MLCRARAKGTVQVFEVTTTSAYGTAGGDLLKSIYANLLYLRLEVPWGWAAVSDSLSGTLAPLLQVRTATTVAWDRGPFEAGLRRGGYTPSQYAHSRFDVLIYSISVWLRRSNSWAQVYDRGRLDEAWTESNATLLGAFQVNAITGQITVAPHVLGDFRLTLVVTDFTNNPRVEAYDHVPVATFAWTTVAADTSNATNGPNGRGCGANGTATDTVRLDNAFVCACRQGFAGDNCEIVVRPAAAAAAAGGGGGGGKDTEALTVAFVATVVSLLCIVLMALAFSWHQKRLRARRPHDFEARLRELFEQGEIPAILDAGDIVKPVEIHRSAITLGDKLGEGAFGEVWSGVYTEAHDKYAAKNFRQRGNRLFTLDVAVKSIKQDVPVNKRKEAEEELLRESSIIAQIKHHDNVSSLIGVVTRGSPLFAVFPLCARGSLLDVVKETGRAILEPQRLLWAKEIAAGMHHLSTSHVVHRDLAARNVLVDSLMISKVSDFGLSRAVKDDDGCNYYRSSGMVWPVRWTAVEAMETMKFTSASDVWSYAITLVEMYGNGAQPYATLKLDQVVAYVRTGQVLARIPAVPVKVYNILVQCWDRDPLKRPTFYQLLEYFEKRLANQEIQVNAQGLPEMHCNASEPGVKVQYVPKADMPPPADQAMYLVPQPLDQQVTAAAQGSSGRSMPGCEQGEGEAGQDVLKGGYRVFSPAEAAIARKASTEEPLYLVDVPETDLPDATRSSFDPVNTFVRDKSQERAGKVSIVSMDGSEGDADGTRLPALRAVEEVREREDNLSSGYVCCCFLSAPFLSQPH